MKYIMKNNKRFLVKENGDVTNVEVSEEQINVSEAVEVTEAEVNTPEETLSNEDVEGLKSYVAKTVKSAVDESIKTVEAIKSINGEVKSAIANAFKSQSAKASFTDGSGNKSYSPEEVVAGIKSVKKQSGKSFDFTFKTLSELDSLTGNVILEDRRSDITRAPVRPLFVEDLLSSTSTISDKVNYTECIGETGEPLTTEELADIQEKDFEFNVFSSPVRKITVMHKQSNEILEDAPQLVGLIKQWLQEDMNLKAEDKILFGDGSANEFTGIYTMATSFSAGTFANKVVDANNMDVLRVAINQIMNASKSRYYPTEIFMNNDDVTAMELTKDANNNYIMPPFTSADKTQVKGVKIISSNTINSGEFLVGDFRKGNVANRRALNVQIATENSTDFEKDMIAIRLTRRFAFYVRHNDAGAFVKGTFADAIADIKKV